ncbi:MAG: hypothetical protein J5J00_13100 [Deltaproteobacteria bacterium]|nr:hypothetical protein [Deltaproteobacteria bacterium]
MLTLAGCEPRGETVSVEQVFAIQSARYLEAKESAALDGQTKAMLEKVETQLQELVKSPDKGTVVARGGEIAEALSSLISKAGYTSRPAMYELVSQYRSLVGDAAPTSAPVTLLAARTFSILSAELESTEFSVS